VYVAESGISGTDAKMRRRRRRPRSQAASEQDLNGREVRYHQEQPEDGIQLGCVALGKVRYRIRDPRARVPARCAMGFALRTDEDVCKCLAASGPSECWKAMDGVFVVVNDDPAPDPVGPDRPAEAAD
jgi:hypothetical protein